MAKIAKSPALRLRLPAASPTAIAVAPLTSLALAISVAPPLRLKKTRILLEAELGVIVTLNPVISV